MTPDRQPCPACGTPKSGCRDFGEGGDCCDRCRHDVRPSSDEQVAVKSSPSDLAAILEQERPFDFDVAGYAARLAARGVMVAPNGVFWDDTAHVLPRYDGAGNLERRVDEYAQPAPDLLAAARAVVGNWEHGTTINRTDRAKDDMAALAAAIEEAGRD